jgi:hypothetical protein
MGPAPSQFLSIQTVTGTSLTSPALSTTTFGTYYNITNSGFNAITLPALGSNGGYWVLRNNTATYLSIALSGTTTGLSTPLSIPPSTSTTIVTTASGYVLF